jgi:hypothetical protein
VCSLNKRSCIQISSPLASSSTEITLVYEAASLFTYVPSAEEENTDGQSVQEGSSVSKS